MNNAIFDKPLSSLSFADVERIVSEGFSEGTQIEYKQELPCKNQRRDPWLDGGSQISEYARNQLLKEIVAFANGVGGYLIIGIEETTTKPAKAAGIKAIPRCAELAEKFRLQIRDCVEPKIPLVYAEGVVYSEESDEGVIVIHVPQSRMAPHRLKPTLECYIRRNDRSEQMTMREIQDLTINRASALHSLNENFQEKQRNFHQLMLSAFPGNDCNGIRATVIPLSADLWVDRVHKNNDLHPSQESFAVRIGNPPVANVPINAYPQAYATQRRPLLRGSRYYHVDDQRLVRQEIYCDGTVEYIFIKTGNNNDCVWAAWPISLAFNAMLTADLLRVYAGFPDIEYGLEIALANSGVSSHPLQLGDFYSSQKFPLEDNLLLLPRISIGHKEEFSEVLQIINQDLWDCVGVEHPEIKITFPNDHR